MVNENATGTSGGFALAGGGAPAPPNRGWSSRMLHEHITTGNTVAKIDLQWVQ